jgi:hypothetical protein
MTYDVKVWHQLTEHRIVVRARDAQQAMEQALVLLKLSFESVTKMEAKERS